MKPALSCANPRQPALADETINGEADGEDR
jgi:hypothetical protein